MTTKQTADKSKTKSKTASVKKVSVSFDKDFYAELNDYALSRGYAVEDYIKKAVKEKLDSSLKTHKTYSLLFYNLFYNPFIILFAYYKHILNNYSNKYFCLSLSFASFTVSPSFVIKMWLENKYEIIKSQYRSRIDIKSN